MKIDIHIYRKKDDLKSYGIDKYFFALNFPESSFEGSYIYLYSFCNKDNRPVGKQKQSTEEI